jgi:hypothetical protein
MGTVTNSHSSYHYHNIANMSDNTSASTTTSRLLGLPAELRNRIWAYTMKGGKSISTPCTALSISLTPHLPDGHVIHMDHQQVWHALETDLRLNLSQTCTQIRHETAQMFHAHNTFLFQTRDRRKNYGILENCANWLFSLSEQERESVGKIVLCSGLAPGLVNWGWVCAGYCEMDFGFEVGRKIDLKTRREREDGEVEEVEESWGREQGHFCNKGHYLLVPKKQRQARERGEKKKRVEE